MIKSVSIDVILSFSRELIEIEMNALRVYAA